MSNRDDKVFRDLIRAEFGEDVAPIKRRRRKSSPAGSSLPSDFSMAEALERNAPDDDSWAAWHPELGPRTKPRKLVIFGSTLLVIALLIGAIALGGAPLPRIVAMGMVLCAATGLGLLIAAIPKHRDDDPKTIL